MDSSSSNISNSLFNFDSPDVEVSDENNNKQTRRSASYHPTIWDPKLIHSFFSPYSYKLNDGRLKELKRMARRSLETPTDLRALLSLVDSMQRLGVAYHFEYEIGEAVSLVHRDDDNDDLYTTALKFRVLREHGRPVSSDIFDRFRGEDGRFVDGALSGDVRGVLSLYEASHLGTPEEDGVMSEAKSFAVEKLKRSCSGREEEIRRSLEVPLHWRVPRIEARDSIDYLDQRLSPSTLLELAKLDYNLVQSVYQDELKVLACWWSDLGFKETLHFARDRLMENYLWVMGIVFEPGFSRCRVGVTKFVCILTAIDDVYDIYGSLDELESFTDAVQRWDVEAMMGLPLYMRTCYLAMLNFGNEIIDDVLKNHDLDVSLYIKEEWLSLCRSYLVEARWFNSGYTPGLEEYLANACISVGGRAGIVHACVLLLDFSTPRAALDSCFEQGAKLIHLSSLITRLSDDLGTSKEERERGDVAKSVECYMLEKGTSEEEARGEMRELISQTWKMMNKEAMNIMMMGSSNNNNNNNNNKSLVKMCMNMARTAQFIFQHGDGIGTSTGLTRDRLSSLIVKPVPFEMS